MSVIPTPRRPDDRHWCAACVECAGCNGGRDRLPARWTAVIAPTGACVALCTDCYGLAVLCPTLTPQEAT